MIPTFRRAITTTLAILLCSSTAMIAAERSTGDDGKSASQRPSASQSDKQSSKKSTLPSKPSTSSRSSRSATASKPKLTGKVSGSFVNGRMVLTKFAQKNGWHKGEPVVVLVDKSSHFTYVFQKQKSNKVFLVYRASNAIGTEETPTPYGPYRVTDKLTWPSWIPPKSIDPTQKAIHPYNKDRKNPLGVARISLDKFGIALHGTNAPKTLRTNASHGCVRHSNKDIMAIYKMVKPGSRVIIARKYVGSVLTEKDFRSS